MYGLAADTGQPKDSAPITIRNFDGYEVQRGAVLVLVYLTPADSDAYDVRAYGEIIASADVAEANAATAWGQPGVGLLTGVTQEPYKRVSDRVWQCTVVVAQGGLIGELVPRTLNPGPDKNPSGQYTLESVQLWRESGGFLTNLATSAQNVVESVTAAVSGGMAVTSTPAAAESVSSAAQDTVKSIKDTAKEIVPKASTLLLFALLIAAVAFVVSKRGLRIGKAQIL